MILFDYRPDDERNVDNFFFSVSGICFNFEWIIGSVDEFKKLLKKHTESWRQYRIPNLRK